MLKTIRFFNSAACQYARRAPGSRNPGIERRLKVMSSEDGTMDQPEHLDDFESDFMNVHKSHKEFEADMKRHDEKIRHIMIKNKYFKRPANSRHNFLTWTEKEQIRFLHKKDSIEWSPQRLSESFPADEETVRKVIRANWQPGNSERIQKHDATVNANWEKLRSGELDIDPILAKHLQNFQQRTIKAAVYQRSIDEPKLKALPEGEFSNIITSCKGYKQIEDKYYPEKAKLSPPVEERGTPAREEDTFSVSVADRKMSKEPMTLREMHERDGNNVDELIAVAGTNLSGTGIVDLQLNPAKQMQKVNKFNTDDVQLNEKDMRHLSISPIRHEIQIPRKLWKDGATYKLGDCFYDDDGEFLYRVPGMTGSSTGSR